MRKTPVKHTVSSHTRDGHHVKSYTRGRGGGGSTTTFRAVEPQKRDEHGRIMKKIGDSISFRFPDGRRSSGTIVGVREEYYLVYDDGKVYKVDRKSVFTVLGGALKGGAKIVAKAGYAIGKGGVLVGKGLGKAISKKLEERRERKEREKAFKEELKKIREEEEELERKRLEREKVRARYREERKKAREKARREARKGPLYKRIGRGAVEVGKATVTVSKKLLKEEKPKKTRKKKA